MAKSKYRIDETLLHKKRYGKNTMTSQIINGAYVTTGSSSVFYHYTSPEGLKGILQTRTLFFTDCQYLNDYRERISINDNLSSFWAAKRNEYDKDFRKLIENYRLNDYEDNLYEYSNVNLADGSGNELYRYFILSASENPDSLSMWKYYSKNGTYDGYCIGLATYALCDEWIDRDTGVAIEEGRVIYNTQQKINAIQTAVERLYNEWCVYKLSDDFNEKIIKEYHSWVSLASLFFKDEYFESEQEYRFIAVAPTSKLKVLQYNYDGMPHMMFDFRLSGGVFIPYIKMPFFYWNEECWPIREIGIGPSHNGEQKKNGIVQYIKYLNYEIPDIYIYNSKIPLRY